jgi:hypothetical protein
MSFRSILSTLIPFVLTLLPVRVLAQAPENVGTGTAAIELGDTIQDCSSGGNTCSTTYPQIYWAHGTRWFRGPGRSVASLRQAGSLSWSRRLGSQ